MEEKRILVERQAGGVVGLTLNRPELHNAFDERLIAELTEAVHALADDAEARLILLRAKGKSFSAGADLDWMRRAADFTLEQNIADTTLLADMLHAVATLPQPTLVLVQGAVVAGAVGLIACCDVAIAVERARFGLSEVRLGLIPATISPHVIAAIGPRQARRYFLTAERFDATEALRIGLVHQVVADDDALARAGDALIQAFHSAGPGAVAETKALIRDVAGTEQSDAQRADLARRLAERRVSDEGKAGLAAFFDKTSPPWAR
jgi:methylglutaconyl-CoA hydratase